jgi:hypothetical protein
MENKIKFFYKYLIHNLIPALGFSVIPQVSYTYITEKTVHIKIVGISKDMVLKLNNIKVNFEQDLNKIFEVDINIKKGNYYDYADNIFNVYITDITKINYTLASKLLNQIKEYQTSKCDNYFCYIDIYESNQCLFKKGFDLKFLYMEYFNTFRTIDSDRINNLNEGVICESVKYRMPSKKWIQSQVDYIKNLDSLSNKILLLYTGLGSGILNPFMLNKMRADQTTLDLYDSTFKETYELLMGMNKEINIKNVASYLRKLIRHLTKIINGSPQSDSDFYVYRGIRDRLHNLKKGDEFIHNAFTSTSAFCDVAIMFSKNLNIPKVFDYGTIFRYKLKTSCLLMSKTHFFGEYEILLPPSEQYYIKRIEQNSEFIYKIDKNSKVLYNHQKEQKILIDYIELF